MGLNTGESFGIEFRRPNVELLIGIGHMKEALYNFW